MTLSRIVQILCKRQRHLPKYTSKWVFDQKGHNFTVNENCNPLFCFMFSVKLSYGMSKNNRMLMIVNGYKFSLHYSRNCKERWQCTRRSYFGCKAVLHKKEGAITYQNIFHNHEPWCFLVHVQCDTTSYEFLHAASSIFFCLITWNYNMGVVR